jgi:hypothetical protein
MNNKAGSYQKQLPFFSSTARSATFSAKKGFTMSIWVDADACPNVIKEVLYRAAERAKVTVTFVANQPLRVPPSPWLKTLQVAAGFDSPVSWSLLAIFRWRRKCWRKGRRR